MFVELLELTVDAYIESYGQVEAVEIMKVLSTSKSFKENLQIALQRGDIPSIQNIEGIVRSASYKMLLSKKRKVYYGALFFLKALHSQLHDNRLYIDEYEFGQRLMQLRDMYKIESGI